MSTETPKERTQKKSSDTPIKWEEFKKHSDFNSCWILINGKVYDVTKFKNHPGHYEILVGSSKKDATQVFKNVNHSEKAVNMLKSFYKGEMDMESIPEGDLELSGGDVQYWFVWMIGFLMFSALVRFLIEVVN